MRLPTLVVASFRRSCQSDIDDINDFLAEYDHADLVAEVELARQLGRLRTALWTQWRCMETAWCNHEPALARAVRTLDREGTEAIHEVEPFGTQTMDNNVPGVPTVTAATDDSGESILDDPDIYYYRCAFCPTMLDTGAELKTHIDSFHQHELFQFRCDTCGFKAKGPRYLRGHKRLVHNDHRAGE
jgi:hypothetical protein